MVAESGEVDHGLDDGVVAELPVLVPVGLDPGHDSLCQY